MHALVVCLLLLAPVLVSPSFPYRDLSPMAGEQIPSDGSCRAGAEGQPDDGALHSALLRLMGDDANHYGVVLQRLDGSPGFAHQAQRVFYAASLYKLAIMVELFRQRDAGAVRFEEELVVSETDAAEDLGTLEPLGIAGGDAVALGRLLGLMITVSDNTSAVMLQRRLGGQQVDLAMQELGLQATSVRTPDLPTTAADMATLLVAIAEGRAVSTAASEEMAALLQRQTYRSWIPAGVPAEVAVGNKTASWSEAAHDVGIVYAPFGTYVLVVLSDLPAQSTMLAEVSREIYECLSPTSQQQSAIGGIEGRPGLRADS